MKIKDKTKYIYRPVEAGETDLLKEFLYMAIYVPPGQQPPPREALELPEIRHYITDWGREHDRGLLAAEKSSGDVIGAAWLRIWPENDHGYGYVDTETPELTISVHPDHRGHGVGTELIKRLLKTAAKHHKAVSLSVDKINTSAFRLYQRLGFRVIRENKDDFIMLWTPADRTGADFKR